MIGLDIKPVPLAFDGFHDLWDHMLGNHECRQYVLVDPCIYITFRRNERVQGAQQFRNQNLPIETQAAQLTERSESLGAFSSSESHVDNLYYFNYIF